jgi:hypothetical protein
VTPLHIQIAIHYHCSTEQWPQLHIPVHLRYAIDLNEAGLLECTAEEICGLPPKFRSTDGLAIFVNAICATPVPKLQWVMPARPCQCVLGELRS